MFCGRSHMAMVIALARAHGHGFDLGQSNGNSFFDVSYSHGPGQGHGDRPSDQAMTNRWHCQQRLAALKNQGTEVSESVLPESEGLADGVDGSYLDCGTIG